MNGLAAVDWVQVGEMVGLLLAVFGGTAVGVSRVVQAKLAEALKPVVVGVVQEVLPPLVAKEVELNREAEGAACRAELDAMGGALDDMRQRLARLEGASEALATVMGASGAPGSGGAQAA
ncbi:hypothetical protein [Stigmatella erecta]|uniref:Uncharacterized protein n=1 Tax=Stigmatella erecta TaxID=83460 RepID=A0A1I0LAZ2_9BACT|nr:hypothetical protein [Stigmatella erecta]SEU36970.1 hypothetical protein SAMN05443639_12325 [Stigmatella erecta]